ncbi:MAG: hypothetical protein ACKV2Q_32885 [Planctomycetaceae bacterium]
MPCIEPLERERRRVALFTENQKYFFFFYDDGVQDLLITLWQYVLDPDLDFGWDDLVEVMQTAYEKAAT